MEIANRIKKNGCGKDQIYIKKIIAGIWSGLDNDLIFDKLHL